MLLDDNETTIDLLNYEAIVKSINSLILSAGESPVTIGVHGDWGAGKSSILRMLEASFEGDEETVCLWFNSWVFQGFEDAKVVVLETILAELLRQRPALKKATDKVKSLWARIRWAKVAKRGGRLAFLAATGIPHPSDLADVAGGLKNLATGGDGEIDPKDVDAFANQLSGLADPSSTSRAADELHGFRTDFEELLRDAKIERLVILVDDLDRCLPETAIDTLEAIKLFCFVPRCSFVVAADDAMIEHAVRRHFPDLPASVGAGDYSRNYLEKMIQVPIRIPSVGPAETRVFLLVLLIGQIFGPESKEGKALYELAKKAFKVPWDVPRHSAEEIQEALGQTTSEVKAAILVAQQISQLLSEGTKGNPRQIKRFVNTLLLRESIGAALGISEYLKGPAAAKLLLLERFAPRRYDELGALAASTADGKVNALEPLEFAKDGEGESQKEEMSSLSAWREDEWVSRWLRLSPSLNDVDLRPYYFIAREGRRRRDPGPLQILDELADQLLQGRVAAARAAAEIKSLDPEDATKVFNHVADEVRIATSLSDQPPGMDGLVALCEAHEHLQPQLVELMNSFPPERLGPWAASSWFARMTNEVAKGEATKLLNAWAGEEKNDKLKAAATTVIGLLKD